MNRSRLLSLLLSALLVFSLGLASAQDTSASADAPVAKINLNDTTEEALLATIPDFSGRMVREFFEYRPYVSISQFRREIGKYVDEAQLAFYEEYVYVPVDVNNSDAATLTQLPGVDEDTATTLIEGRPYASNEAFLEELTTLVPDTDPAVAGNYLAALSD